jgi:hypothetical protein
MDATGSAAGVRLAVVVDYPVDRLADGHSYEECVLRLLGDHGGHVEQRLVTPDGVAEVQVLVFASRDGYASFVADERRARLREEFAGSTPATRVLEVTPRGSGG